MLDRFEDSTIVRWSAAILFGIALIWCFTFIFIWKVPMGWFYAFFVMMGAAAGVGAVHLWLQRRL